jgi:hypothetical protein
MTSFISALSEEVGFSRLTKHKAVNNTMVLIKVHYDPRDFQMNTFLDAPNKEVGV